MAWFWSMCASIGAAWLVTDITIRLSDWRADRAYERAVQDALAVAEWVDVFDPMFGDSDWVLWEEELREGAA